MENNTDTFFSCSGRWRRICRLIIFEFLATSELSDEQDNVGGNYGLQDQILAFQWVNKNIRNFTFVFFLYSTMIIIINNN